MIAVEEAQNLEITDRQVRIESIISGISHGTEMSVYRGMAPFFKKKFDWNSRLFMDTNEDSASWTYPIRSSDPGVWYMGYSNVGRVIEVGKEVAALQVGDIVYSQSPHQSQVIQLADQVVKLPDSLGAENGLFFTNLMTAYNGILDSRIKLGDTVVVSGLGVLGQLIVQMAKMSGAFQVIGIDLYNKRLETALDNGADIAINPKICPDIAHEVRKLTRNKGADLVIEVTGNQAALREAIRIAAPDTTVTALGWYQGECAALDLSEEFHLNRIQIRSSQTAGIDPSISYLWDKARKENMCVQLLQKLKLHNLLTHTVPFESIAEAYELVDQRAPDIIQVALTY